MVSNTSTTLSVPRGNRREKLKEQQLPFSNTHILLGKERKGNQENVQDRAMLEACRVFSSRLAGKEHISTQSKLATTINGLVNILGEITAEAKEQHGSRSVLQICIADSAVSHRECTTYCCQTADFYVSITEYPSHSLDVI